MPALRRTLVDLLLFGGMGQAETVMAVVAFVAAVRADKQHAVEQQLCEASSS
jgi:hypothetical protein